MQQSSEEIQDAIDTSPRKNYATRMRPSRSLKPSSGRSQCLSSNQLFSSRPFTYPWPGVWCSSTSRRIQSSLAVCQACFSHLTQDINSKQAFTDSTSRKPPSLISPVSSISLLRCITKLTITSGDRRCILLSLRALLRQHLRKGQEARQALDVEPGNAPAADVLCVRALSNH